MSTPEANVLSDVQAPVAAPKVLVIDDEIPLQQAIKLALKNEGYALYFADNGQQGLELFREHKPELVFLDLRMPVMDGYQFLQAVDSTETASEGFSFGLALLEKSREPPAWSARW